MKYVDKISEILKLKDLDGNQVIRLVIIKILSPQKNFDTSFWMKITLITFYRWSFYVQSSHFDWNMEFLVGAKNHLKKIKNNFTWWIILQQYTCMTEW